MLKYVLLKLLASQPRHGYDLMRLFSERGWGNLAAGTIYPLLAKLEELGYVEGANEGEKRTYRITEAGRQRLRDVAQDLEAEFDSREPQMNPQGNLREALGRLNVAVSQAAATMKPQTSTKVADRLDALRKEIYSILADE